MKALGELGALGGSPRRGAWGTRGLHGEAGKPGPGLQGGAPAHCGDAAGTGQEGGKEGARWPRGPDPVPEAGLKQELFHRHKEAQQCCRPHNLPILRAAQQREMEVRGERVGTVSLGTLHVGTKVVSFPGA